jgi:site-specific recombinase XerD
MSEQISLNECLAAYLKTVEMSRSARTAKIYATALQAYFSLLSAQGADLEAAGPEALDLEALKAFIDFLSREYSPATERLYLVAVRGFYEFLEAEEFLNLNQARLHAVIRRRARRRTQKLPQFPQAEIETLLEFAEGLALVPVEDETERLICLRDRAFLITLADTGLRVHEACKMTRGELNWQEGKALVLGKGGHEALVRFSSRALRALRAYLEARRRVDGADSRPLSALPLFARHDRAAGKKVRPISTVTGRNIVRQRGQQALGEQAEGLITPHTLRHYFVTTVLRGTGNLRLAQELARHRSITSTQIYAHLASDELDQGYYDVFESGE